MASTGKQTYFFFEILSKLQITHYSRFSWHPTEIKVYFIKLAKHFVLCLKGLQLQFRSKVKLKSTWGEKVFTVAACPRAHLRYPSGNLKKSVKFLTGKKSKKFGKGKTVSLNDFVAASDSGTKGDAAVVVVPKSSWWVNFHVFIFLIQRLHLQRLDSVRCYC